jgi:uncharacterized protein (DUF2141 family)
MTRTWSRHAFTAVLVVVFGLVMSPAANAAGMQSRIDHDAFSGLRLPLRAGAKVAVNRVPLLDGQVGTLDLESFDILSSDAVLAVYGDNGSVTYAKFPATRYFRGRVAGDATSMVFLAIRETGEVAGFVMQKDRRLMVRTQRKLVPTRLNPRNIDEQVLVEEASSADDMDPISSTAFHCNVENTQIPVRQSLLHATSNGLLKPISETLSATGTRYLRIAVSTDFELYTRRGSSVPNISQYIVDLLAAASVVYQRDLKTELTLVYTGVYTTIADPFTVTPLAFGTGALGSPVTNDALYEFGGFWHATPPSGVARSAAMLVSGKTFPDAATSFAGIAWVDTACEGDFAHASANAPAGFGGAYGFFNGASLGGSGEAIPNPNGNVNFQATTSIFDNTYWTLMAFVHELGHVVGSVHTHCVGLTAPEKVTYGVSRDFVDICYSGEGGCYPGATSVPTELGSIMSYCHLIGFGPATRYTFGKVTEPTQKIVDMVLNGSIAFGIAGLTGKVPSYASGVSAPASVTNGIAASASVTATPPGGSSISGYQWTITNGTINGSSTSSSVNFTGTANPVTLRVVVSSANGCAAADSKAITVNPGTAKVRADYNGNGKSDILLRDTTGGIGAWLMNGATISTAGFVGAAGAFTVAGIGDFNNDGKGEVLLRDPSGNIGLWQLNGTTLTAGFFVGSPGGTYTVAGVGDLNGDSKDDIILRDGTGTIGVWFMNGNIITGGALIGSPGGSYNVAGVGDFTGDGKADILLRDSGGTLGLWIMNGSTITSGALVGSPGGTYTVAAVADFNGDGKADILLRDSLGNLGMWIMNGATITTGAFVGSPGGSYTVAAAGDYNGDGKADILLKDGTGTIGVWLMNGSTISSGALVGAAGTSSVY